MIVPRLKGGIGNQLFTIAAAYSTSRDVGSTLRLNYNIPHVGGQGAAPLSYRDTLYKNIESTEIVPKNIFNEPDWSYSQIPPVDDTLLDGYFQSEKHFSKYSNDIKTLLYFPDEVKDKIQKGLSKLPKKILGVHVRLGDYLMPAYSSTHLICDRDYYNKALSTFNLNDYTVVVCTDDIESYKKYINIKDAIICNGKNEIEDMYLLSQCDSNILTNSSFSWWSSYLGKDKEVVCAPSRWFGSDGPRAYGDIYRDNWTIIDV